jgi:hypothetical protein
MASPERLYGGDRVCHIVDRMVMMVHKSNNMYYMCALGACVFTHSASQASNTIC